MKSLVLSLVFCLVYSTNNTSKDLLNFQTYVFHEQITLEVNASNQDTLQFNFLFNKNNNTITGMSLENNPDMGPDDNLTYVFTEQSVEMFIDAAGMKMKKSVQKNEFSQFDNLDKIPEQSQIKKTGNTKQILGYTCHEYSFKNKEGHVIAWVSEDFPIDNKFVPMLGMKANSPFDGFVMELDVNVSSEKTNLKVIDYKKNINFSIDTSAYKTLKF